MHIYKLILIFNFYRYSFHFNIGLVLIKLKYKIITSFSLGLDPPHLGYIAWIIQILRNSMLFSKAILFSLRYSTISCATHKKIRCIKYLRRDFHLMMIRNPDSRGIHNPCVCTGKLEFRRSVKKKINKGRSERMAPN